MDGDKWTDKLIPLTSVDITILSALASLLAGIFGGPVAASTVYGGVNSFLTSLNRGDSAIEVALKTLAGTLVGLGTGWLGDHLSKGVGFLKKVFIDTVMDTGLDLGISGVNGEKITGADAAYSFIVNGIGNILFGAVGYGAGQQAAGKQADPNPVDDVSELPQYSAKGGGGAVTNTVIANGKTVTFKHGGRHVTEDASVLMFNYLEIEDAIANHVTKLDLKVGQTQKVQIPFKGEIIEYNSHLLPDGRINVGTYKVIGY